MGVYPKEGGFIQLKVKRGKWKVFYFIPFPLSTFHLLLILRPLIPSVGLPFGQGESLHGSENAVLEVRVAALELEDQILDLLPLS